MSEVVIPLMTLISVLSLGGAVLSAVAARKRPLQKRLHDLSDEETELAPQTTRNARTLTWLNLVGRLVSSGRPSSKLRSQMAQAGYHSAIAAEVFLGVKMLLLILGIISLMILSLIIDVSIVVRILLPLGGAAALSFLPNIVIGMRRATRQTHIRQALPNTMDLLEICVTSGRMCELRRIVCALPNSMMSLRISMIWIGSRPMVGSSRIRISGSWIIACASPTRC